MARKGYGSLRGHLARLHHLLGAVAGVSDVVDDDGSGNSLTAERIPSNVATGFTGGPCAELVLIGTAATQGVYDLETIVAVGDRDRGVVPPCGRCRQVLVDYFPALTVIVGTSNSHRTISITDLLPESYIWADHQLDTEESAPLSTS
ncbi:cytidine deaminase family protein [Streptomyces sp. NPDC058206]|uniref:cytidine deaminase family protein n=1 Tax=Streptomyces sp. NPDC058206 TaxID=3346382 RepID=UPI0036F0E9DD